MAFAVLLLLAALSAVCQCSQEEGKVFIADSGAGNILRANLDGSLVEQIVVNLGKPVGVAVHKVDGHVYWTDADTWKIQRANLNGTNVEDLVTLADGSLATIALDTTASKMYWVDSAMYNHKIQRANLDGTAVEDFISDGLTVPFGVCVHRESGATGADRVYWSDSFTRKISSANLLGSDVYEHANLDFGSPSGVAWDWLSSRVIWTDTFQDEIRRASFRKGEVETIVKGLDSPLDIALDLHAGKLYWTDQGTRKVQRANLNGGDTVDLIVSGLIAPAGIAILPAGRSGESSFTTSFTSARIVTTSTSTTAAADLKSTTADLDYVRESGGTPASTSRAEHVLAEPARTTNRISSSSGRPDLSMHAMPSCAKPWALAWGGCSIVFSMLQVV